MKKVLTILFILVSYFGISQSVVQRSTQGNTVADSRLMTQLNFFVPRYPDTATASVSKGIDTCGSIIYTYDVNKLWYRNCSPFKHWELVGTGSSTPVLPDGVYAGGNVAWSGTGLIFNVSPASYVLNGIAYTYNGGTVTLPPADPTFARIDYIILDSTGANFVEGVPSANPQAPSLNPQTQLGRAFVTIPANSTIPLIQTNIIFDENLGQPSEWDATSNGTVVFGNTNFPYHLTIAAAATGFVDADYILMSNDSSYNSSQQGSMVLFIRLGGALSPAQNLNINILNAGGMVGQTLNATSYGLNRNLLNAYQPIIIPMPDFGAANLVFNKISITASGAGTFPQFNFDYWQFQNGFVQISVQQNAITTIKSDVGVFNATTPNSLINVTGTNGVTDTISNDTLKIDGSHLIFNQPSFDNSHIQNAIMNISGSASVGTSFQVSGIDNFTSPDFSVNRFGDGYTRPVVLLSQNLQTFAGPVTEINTGLLRISNGAVIDMLTQPLVVQTRNPNSTSNNLTLTDVDNGFDVTSAFQWLTIIKKVNSVVDSLSYIDRGGGYRSDTTSGYKRNFNALLTANDWVTKKYVDSISGGGAFVTSIGFNTATGIRSTAEPLTSTGTIRIDTTVIATRAYVQTFGTFYNTNVGSSYRFAIPNTNTIKTLRVLNGILADSSTSNTISIQVDSATYATKAFVASVAGGGGFTGVTSVSVVNANGFNGSVATPTTTPAITITTTATGTLKGNGTAISAAAGSDLNTTFGSQTANFIYAAPNGSAGNPTFRAMVVADVPTLNQNTTGTAATITGIATVSHGGTGLSTLTAFGLMAAGTTSTGNMQQVAAGTAGQVLTSNGAGSLPTFQAVSVTSGVSSITGTANEIIASASTGAVTLSTPQPIATTSNVTFQRGTFTGAATTANLILSSHTDPTAAAGVLTNNGTRLAFSLATTYKRFIFSNDVTPTAGQGLFGNGTDFTVGSYTAADNGMVVTPSATGVTFKTNSTPQTLTSGATITWNVANGENANLTLANTGATLNLTNPVAGHTYVLQITQGTGGSRTITTWPAGTVWPSGTAPVLGTAVGARNLISLYYNGTSFFGAFNPNTYQ